MTTPRTMGQCHGTARGCFYGAPHTPDCPTLYPPQRQPGDEKDALTRLVAHIRLGAWNATEAFTDAALALISEAREAHKSALLEVGALIGALESEKARFRDALLATQKRMGEVRQRAMDEGREQGHLDAFLWLRAHHNGILAPTAEDMRVAITEMMDAE